MSERVDEERADGEVELSQEAGEWAVVAMACMAMADGVVVDAELERARELVKSTAIIRDTLGPEFGEQRFVDIVERIAGDPASEMEHVKEELRALAGRIAEQAQRDIAFQTLISVACADREIAPAERKLMVALKEILGTTVLVPQGLVSCD